MSLSKVAVIVAGGSGTRMGTTLPKQFLPVHGKPLLYYTIKSFLDAFDDLKVILVLPDEYLPLGQEIIDAYFDTEQITITLGGRTRFHSVQNGLSLIKEECMVFVHDGVRSMISSSLIQKCYEAALEWGNAIPAIPCSDSVRQLTEEGNEIIDRKTLMLIQTPQTFHSKIILPAFNGIDYKEHFTDEATVVEAFGLKIHLIEGEERNLKITKPTDLLIAEKILENEFE